jgi:hypothetical protein
MKTYGGVEVQLHYPWPLHYLQVSGQLHAPAALLPGKIPQYPLCRRLGRPQSRYGHHKVEKIILLLPGIEPRTSSP